MPARLGGDITAGARSVLDHEWPAEPLRQPLTDQTREDVVRPAGGKTDDNAHWPRWIGLRRREARQGREHCSTGCKVQESATAKFHNLLLGSARRAPRLPAIPRASA